MKRKDLLLTLCLIFAALIVYIFIQIMGNAEGNEVIITVEGDKYGTYPLSENKEINVETRNGYNTIVVLNGEVYIDKADCPDKYCVNQGKISKTGETLICLPHKLSVEISASDNEGDLDAVVK